MLLRFLLGVDDSFKKTDGFHILRLTEVVKRRAADSFPTIIGTLEALHPASALIWRNAEGLETLSLLTADTQMATCARYVALRRVTECCGKVVLQSKEYLASTLEVFAQSRVETYV
jgi:hypothetical protein